MSHADSGDTKQAGRPPDIASVTLTSYLSGQQDGRAWALIDNLDADDVREVAEQAITMLREANACIGVAAVALDEMAERKMRFAAREVWVALAEPYLAALSQRLNGAGIDSSPEANR